MCFLPCSGKAQKASDAEPSDALSYSRIRVEEVRDRAVHNIHICQDKEGRGRKEIRQGKHSDNTLYISESDGDAGEKQVRETRETENSEEISRSPGNPSDPPNRHQNVRFTVSNSDALPQIMLCWPIFLKLSFWFLATNM